MKRLIFGALLVITHSLLFAQDLQWQVRNPLPIGDKLSSITFANGVFVVVDTSGAILTSSDGLSWTNRTIAAGLRDITFGEGMYVAVGGAKGRARVFTSRDAINWVQRFFAGGSLKNVVYGNGRFVATGPHNICLSLNGVQWQEVRSGLSAALHDLAFGDGQFAIMGELWSKYATTPSVIFTSRNGGEWTRQRVSDSSPQIEFESEIMETLGRAGVYFYDTPPPPITSVAYGNGRYIGVGTGGAIALSLVSPGGEYNTQWRNITGASDHNLVDVEYGNGRYLALADGGMLMSSSNGVDWGRQWIGWAGNLPSYMTALAFGNGVFVAVGSISQYTLRSADGKQWSGRGLRTLGSDGFVDVAFGNGMFMAVGHDLTRTKGLIKISNDGLNWNFAFAAAQGRFLGVDFDGTYFVVTKLDGTFLYTADAQTWTEGPPAGWEPPVRTWDTRYGRVNAVTAGDAGVVAVGDRCLILHSTP